MKSKKWQETKSLSMTELQAKLNEAQEQLFRLKFRNASVRVKNPLEIRNTRRIIAQLNTLLRERALAEVKTAKK